MMTTTGEGRANLNKLITARTITESLLSTLFQTERIEWLRVNVHQFTKCPQYFHISCFMERANNPFVANNLSTVPAGETGLSDQLRVGFLPDVVKKSFHKANTLIWLFSCTLAVKIIR